MIQYRYEKSNHSEDKSSKSSERQNSSGQRVQGLCRRFGSYRPPHEAYTKGAEEAMTSKFQPGDRVRFSLRVPRYIKAELRCRTRRVKACRYDSQLQATLYELGSNYQGSELCRLFRSYELCKVTLCKVGRPKTKRSYRLKLDSKLPALTPNALQTAYIAKGIALPLPLTVSRQQTQISFTASELDINIAGGR